MHYSGNDNEVRLDEERSDESRLERSLDRNELPNAPLCDKLASLLAPRIASLVSVSLN